MRRQIFLDVSMHSGGGGTNPDGSPTPYIDLDVTIERLQAWNGPGLVLDPEGSQRWTIQCALRDAFGWDGRAETQPHHIQRLRDLAATMDYLPPLRVHDLVVVGKHDECHMPHPGDDN